MNRNEEKKGACRRLEALPGHLRPQSQAHGTLGLSPAGSSPVWGQTQHDHSTCVGASSSLAAGLWVFSSGPHSKSPRHGQLPPFLSVRRPGSELQVSQVCAPPGVPREDPSHRCHFVVAHCWRPLPCRHGHLLLWGPSQGLTPACVCESPLPRTPVTGSRPHPTPTM